MRRASYSPLPSQAGGEPMIVVEESGASEEELSLYRNQKSSPRQSLDIDSPSHNPYLLSPWRDPRETRKHSLPTPQCTSGITASQVRRLSERGGEGSGPSAREQDFLATLYSQPAPTGRRHSIVTISKVPTSLFGKNRRESIAALPSSTGATSRTILASRRESATPCFGPPSASDHRGSVHNLQLDIMDDIVSARKVRMKMWSTSKERVCEVQAFDETGSSVSPVRYTQQSSQKEARRFSDFVGLTPPPIPPRRRASEHPNLSPLASTSSSSSSSSMPKRQNAGIICTNTDLLSILSSLTSSATEINECGLSQQETEKRANAEQRRNRLKTSRSNSFDISILQADIIKDPRYTKDSAGTSWFVKRHQPMSKKESKNSNEPLVTFLLDKSKLSEPISKEPKQTKNTVVWDEKSGSTVDAEALGSAIEGFLRRGTGSESGTSSPSSQAKGAIPKIAIKPSGKSSNSSKNGSSWFSGKGTEEESAETCDSSLCSTLKDLFVK